MRFLKGHGTGNDFVLIPDLDGAHDLSPVQVRALCDRRFGIGGDGVLRVVRTAAVEQLRHLADQAEFFMDYRNGDGSTAEMCGNGARLFGRFLVADGLAAPGSTSILTRGGVRRLQVPDVGDVSVGMGVPVAHAGSAQVLVGDDWLKAVAVTVPNPHLVVAVDDVAAAGELRQPPEYRPAALFPDGANVEFVADVGPQRISMRVHERGAAETLSCGTGACAAAWVTMRRDGAAPGTGYRVDVPGGALEVTELPDGELVLTGPAVIVAEGSVRLPDLLP
jgi:diaminopimelate epimerase